MASVDIAQLIIDDSIEAKIKAKTPPLTPTEVREAVIYAKDAFLAWEDDDTHGSRLVVRGKTRSGRSIIAYLIPLNENDPEEGTFKLKTALAQPT